MTNDTTVRWSVPAPELVTVRITPYTTMTNAEVYYFALYPLHGGWRLQMNNGLYFHNFPSLPSEAEVAAKANEMIKRDINHMKWRRETSEQDERNRIGSPPLNPDAIKRRMSEAMSMTDPWAIANAYEENAYRFRKEQGRPS